MSDILEVNPKDAKLRLGEENPPVLIDVREPEEFALAHIEGSQLLPMQSIPGELQRLEALADERDLLVLCHHGVRSLQVVAWLREHGIENCFSVLGGIDQWSREIDPGVPRY
ncbi:MAG TPA: rhodanese-like domain-containing protein [Bryobacteraceae bacterium]|jgi:rhodanese-related sulfurtransferase|nr:rhodanese-like domain-containing protein [Bryobacteraceae bacterium]